MYDTQSIANTIRQMVKKADFSLSDMLSELGMGVNSISQFANGHELSVISFAEIADYLKVSTDYLLGRTENATSTNSNNTISGNNNIIGNHNSQTITTDTLSTQEQQLLTYFRNLGEVEKAKILLYAAEISEN